LNESSELTLYRASDIEQRRKGKLKFELKTQGEMFALKDAKLKNISFAPK